MTSGHRDPGSERREDPAATAGPGYARRLQQREGVWWKRVLDVQAPYRWNLRRHDLGRTLDVGCGIGRNLATLPRGSLGVDHNADSVAVARARGLHALTVAEWKSSELRQEGGFEGMLVAHVLEHLDAEAGTALLEAYLPYLRPGGTVLLICPQERGYASDPTHVRFLTGPDMEQAARQVGLEPQGWRSFPLARAAGRVFTYNELVVVARMPG